MIKKLELPVHSNEMGVGAVAVGGLQDFLMISENPVYSLPFKVWGYYDLRHYERVEGDESHQAA